MGWPVVTLVLGCVWAFVAFIAVLAQSVKDAKKQNITRIEI